jgi:hypothetical protein
LPVELPMPPLPVGIMTMKNRTISPVTRLFIDCARELAKPLGVAAGRALENGKRPAGGTSRRSSD